MDAVEYIKAKKRVCNIFSKCKDCPLGKFKDGNCGEDNNAEAAVAALEKWLKENPEEEE